MASLIIDIGNTALKASWCDGMTLGKTFRYQGERMLDFILSLTSKSRPETIVLSSARHFNENSLRRIEKECERLIVFDKELFSRYDIPEYITPDRAASIIASRYLFKGKGIMIFDFGTTLTVDFLDETGRYEHSRLKFSVCAMSSGTESFISGTVDVAGVPLAFTNLLKEEVAKRNAGIDVSRIFLNAIHTHSAPSLNVAMNYKRSVGGSMWQQGEFAKTISPAEYAEFVLPIMADAIVGNQYPGMLSVLLFFRYTSG